MNKENGVTQKKFYSFTETFNFSKTVIIEEDLECVNAHVIVVCKQVEVNSMNRCGIQAC